MIAAPPGEFLHPLPLFFESAGRPLPEFEVVPAASLPRAAHRLLVHAGDMTSKLEEFFGDQMLLRVLQREHTAAHYRREVVLHGAQNGLPVEYGAIEIELGAFPEQVRGEIVEARLPLGGLLNRHGMKYRSEPRAFMRIAPSAWLAGLFDLSAPEEHFGRANLLLGATGEVLARIVEILRPVQ